MLTKSTEQGLAGDTYITTQNKNTFFVKTVNEAHATKNVKKQFITPKSIIDPNFYELLLKNGVLNKKEFEKLKSLDEVSKKKDFLNYFKSAKPKLYTQSLYEYSEQVQLTSEEQALVSDRSKEILKAEVLGVSLEYTALKILNLLGLKTPSELVLMKNPEEAVIIKRKAVDQNLNNKMITPSLEDQVDLDWFIRRQSVLMGLNVVDASINPPIHHNTIPIEHKNGKKRYVDIDPIIVASKFPELEFEVDPNSWFIKRRNQTIAVETIIAGLNEENFFENLKKFSLQKECSTSNQQAQFKFLQDFLQDIDANESKQIKIVQALQKTLYALKKNKCEIEDEVKSFGDFHHGNYSLKTTSDVNPYLPKSSNGEMALILQEKLDKLTEVLQALSVKFNGHLMPYHPTVKNNCNDNYISRKIEPAITVAFLNNIKNELELKLKNAQGKYYNGGKPTENSIIYQDNKWIEQSPTRVLDLIPRIKQDIKDVDIRKSQEHNKY